MLIKYKHRQIWSEDKNGMNEMPKRKPNRLTNYDYSEKGSYFITICAKDKHEMFGQIIVGDAPQRVPHCALSEYGAFIDEQIKKINTIYSHVSVANYVIMPNHIHMIALKRKFFRKGVLMRFLEVPTCQDSLFISSCCKSLNKILI